VGVGHGARLLRVVRPTVSVGATQVPVTYFCDHSFSKSMAACDYGVGCVPVEARCASQSAMLVEMTGCRYRAVCLPLCASVLFVTSSSSLSSGNPVWADVIHIV
jgi:hypothetical protein